MRLPAVSAFSAVALAMASTAAFAFSDEPAPSGPGAQSQFSDPDEAVDNLADSAQGAGGTEVSTAPSFPRTVRRSAA